MFAGSGFVYLAFFIEETLLQDTDIKDYKKAFRALKTLYIMQEYIDMAKHSEDIEFMLRGLVEKHMETCEFEKCRCLAFYKVTNSKHRYELAYSKFHQMTLMDDALQHE